jgi:pimeloyl-ACP methyl ester carboxylesterase
MVLKQHPDLTPQSFEYPYFRTPCRCTPGSPLFIYLPGMDGTGELLRRQLAGLEQAFDIRCLAIPPDDLTSWNDLTEKVVQLIRTELKPHTQRLIYLCGESFGGCLALKVMLKSPQLFDRLVLINPASSFNRYPWIHWVSYLVRPLPEAAYRAACVGFLPFLASLGRIEADDRRALLTAMQSVSQKSVIWRLSLLREFDVSETQLSSITQPTLIVASTRDNLLPSLSEAKRLSSYLPSARIHVLPNSGHASLLESEVNLYDLLATYNFLSHPQQVVKGSYTTTP